MMYQKLFLLGLLDAQAPVFHKSWFMYKIAHNL